MSKQISILMTEADLNVLQTDLINFCNPIFLQDRVTSEEGHLSAPGLLGIPAGLMGEVNLTCYLAPSDLPQQIIFDARQHDIKIIDDLHSNVIQLMRPFYKESAMRAGRFYFQDAYVVNGDWVEKDRAFLDWVNNFFKFVKKNLTRITHERVTYYVGSEAKRLLEDAKIKVIN